MQEKQCHTCKQLKPLSEFNDMKRYEFNKDSHCKPCRKIIYDKSNASEAGRATKKRWKENHYQQFRDSENKRLKRIRQTPEYKIKRRIYMKSWRNLPHNRIDHSFSNAIRINLRSQKKNRKWETLVGYSISDLMKHLENQFQLGMTWENYGKWHVDHKIPKIRFNITSAECEDFRRCWALENLQPLWAKDNLKKSWH